MARMERHTENITRLGDTAHRMVKTVQSNKKQTNVFLLPSLQLNVLRTV